MQFLLRNPHSFVQVETTDDKGQTHTWAVEWAAAGQLATQGVTKDSLKVGDEVTVTGSPARNVEDHRLRMIGVTRQADGAEFGGSFN